MINVTTRCQPTEMQSSWMGDVHSILYFYTVFYRES